METPRILVLLNCFFNTDFIERTVVSILETKYPCDIIFLENPSKYSDDIRILAKKYNVYKHFISNNNMEGNIFHLFCNLHSNIIEKYVYIAMSEADVVLDKESLHEAIKILNYSNNEVEVLSIDIFLDHKKYYNLPIDRWVPKTIKINGYSVGETGFQFIIFKNYVLHEFITSLNKKELVSPVALGVNDYYMMSDSNLTLFIEKRKRLWVRTIKNKLDHIGWEKYIFNNDEYVKIKNENITNKKIRANINLQNYKLKELSK
jgi:hypothetical protein